MREFHRHEQEALEASIRSEYQEWFDFKRISGRRFGETLIRWPEVNWEAGEIAAKGKGDRWVWTPITPTIRAILESCRGQTFPRWSTSFLILHVSLDVTGFCHPRAGVTALNNASIKGAVGHFADTLLGESFRTRM
ncbi:hypothetical protein KEU06_28280 [Pseudaminobacter sp. 19-2017]|uniref:Uncharacterized protein n=1 Tax=Pseudaminobacter soli (ex Zhang et al. 2022) TaxID=2831468 RepID=A0A942I487_9HYPH|nr:hypothetical protein [Pseudaminobacter soli]MBS3652487.1 hypothetical protein [Pseudaminobacter soli]